MPPMPWVETRPRTDADARRSARRWRGRRRLPRHLLQFGAHLLLLRRRGTAVLGLDAAVRSGELLVEGAGVTAEAHEFLLLTCTRVGQLRRAFHRTPGTLSRIAGVFDKGAQYRNGLEFCTQVTRKGGRKALRDAFLAPQTLPRPDEIADPPAWLRRMRGQA